MRRIKLILEYDGTAFHGWQSQKNALAVQDVVAEKLTVLLRHPVKVEGAGRTDAGVHARGQVAAFDTESAKECFAVLKGLNGLLPQTIRCRECEEAPEIFDPRRDALSKIYRYTYWDHPAASTFWRRWSWHAHQPLNEAAMNKVAATLVGEHDFSAFRASGCTAKTPVRTILEAGVRRKGARVTFEIKGHALLHQMVRILAGTLHDLGTGKLDAKGFARILAAKDRKQAGKTAPAEGLVLWQVEYGAIPRPGRKIIKK